MKTLKDAVFDAYNQLKNDNVSFLIICGAIFFRILAAAYVPLGADESYYFDWSKNIHLSYYDHPPGVSWLAYLGQIIFGDNQFGARFGSILTHFASTLVLIAILKRLKDEVSNLDQRALVILTSFSPILSLGGFFIMPDAGLIFFLSLLLLYVLIILPAHKITIFDALACGFLWGMAFNFKYHALAIGGGTMFGLFAARFKNLRHESPFWLLMVLVPLLTAFPVFFWNYKNEWISFVFQTNHGFAKPSLDVSSAMRTLAGQLLLLTPVTFFLYVKTFFNVKKSTKDFIVFMSSAPLGVLLFGLSFYKEILPHWVIPALWLAIPSMVIYLTAFNWKKLWTVNYTYGVILSVSLLLILGIKPVKELILGALDNQTGSLAELTIWDYMKNNSDVISYFEQTDESKCEASIVSFRWFSTSQLAARFNDRKVFCLDKNYRSYYTYRDKNFPKKGCPVVALGNKKHFNKQHLDKFIDLTHSTVIKPKFHEDHSYVLARGTWK